MLNSILLKNNIRLSKPQLNVVIQILDDNIKFNRARRRTSYRDIIRLAIEFIRILRW